MKSESYQGVSGVDLAWRGVGWAGFRVAAGTFLGTFEQFHFPCLNGDWRGGKLPNEETGEPRLQDVEGAWRVPLALFLVFVPAT